MARGIRRLERAEHAVGTDQVLDIALYDSANDELAISGLTAEWRCYAATPRRRKEPFAQDTILTKTTAAGTIALSLGLAQVTITNGDLPERWGEHWQSLRVTDAAGAIVEQAAGPLHLRADPYPLPATPLGGTLEIADGLATVTFTDSDLATLKGHWWQVIRLTDENGVVTEYNAGSLHLRKDSG